MLGTGVEVGFIGCMGSQAADPSLTHALYRYGIDTRHVLRAPGRIHGSCLAVTMENRRLLLTGQGANDALAAHLLARESELTGYLARSSAVHVSSLIDDAVLAPLTRILRNAKSTNPGLLISLDPGAIWSARLATDGMVALAALGDLIFLNGDEARLWRASALVQTFGGIIIEKAADGACAYRYAGGEDVDLRLPPLADQQIRDPVGAGDVFAGGVIAALVGGRHELRKAMELGLHLARRKLVLGEPACFDDCAGAW
jgi:sugar/nucleoside kinase (ribokinase family)